MQNFLIIGSSSGIGRKLSEMLTIAGHRVFGTFKSNPNVSENTLLSYHYLNVLENSLSLDFLPESLDGLIYCPGTINIRPFERIKPEDFLQDYELQVLGAVRVIQSVLPFLKKSKSSSIVLYSSVAVQIGLAYHTQVSASKGAIEGLTKALAAELAPKIRVNCIAPSLTNTPLAAGFLNSDIKKTVNDMRHPLKRIGTSEDIASMTEFLISQKASWVTGQIFHVDGGISTLKI